MANKIELRNNGSNITELVIDEVSILFSYSTPVAGWDKDGAFRTTQHYSKTTTRHINKYLGGKLVGRPVDPAYIKSLLEIGGVPRGYFK